MNLLSREHQPLLYLLIATAFIRLAIAPFLGLGVDEAHYLIYALNLDWSYYDHPPLVGWVQYLFTSIFGVNEFGARVSAIIIGFVTSLFVYKLIYQIDNDAKKSFMAVLALHAAFMFNALFLMLMPDTLLFLFIIPLIFAVIKLEKNNSLVNWLVLGVLLGLSGLSKYTAILFVLPIILYFIIKKRYDMFKDPKIILSILVAFVIISPVLYWNIQTNWESFEYQSNHVIGNGGIHLIGFAQSIAAQFGAYNPLLFPIAFYGLFKALKSRNNVLFLSALFGLVLFLFFTYNSLYKTALPHWSALFYLLFIPIGSYFIYEKYAKYLKLSIGFGIVVSLLIYIEIATKIVPLPDEQSLQVDIYGFEKIMSEANKQIKNPEKEALGVTNWTLASRAIVYNAIYDSEVFLLDRRHDQFDLWQKESPIGKDIIVLNVNFMHKNIDQYMKCENIQNLKSFNLFDDTTKANTIDLVKCSNYQGLK